MAPGTLRISSQFGARDGGFPARGKGKMLHFAPTELLFMETC